MFIKNFCFLILVVIAISAPLTKDEAQNFIKAGNFVPSTATLQTFMICPNGEKVILTYRDTKTVFKFVLGKDGQGKPNLMFNEELLLIGFGGNRMSALPIVMPAKTQNSFQTLGETLRDKKDQMKYPSLIQQQHISNNPKPPCRLDEEQIKSQLKGNLEIFKNAEIKEIKKVGFEWGSGILLEIELTNRNKEYTIHAGYIPRNKKLNVIKIVEGKTKNKMNPLEAGKKMIGKVISQMDKPLKTAENVGLKFENVIQSFVEKLLMRKDLKLGENQQFKQEHSLTKSQGKQKANAKAPFLLGSSDEKQLSQQNLNQIEQNSEQISELVTQVIHKLMLKTK